VLRHDDGIHIILPLPTMTDAPTIHRRFTLLHLVLVLSILSTNAASYQRRPVAFMPAKLSESDLWIIRLASGAATYLGFVAYSDRPQGKLLVNPESLEIKESQVPGAGLGLYLKETLPKNTVLGTYPGVVIPLVQNLDKLRQYPQCEGYVWRFSDNNFIIDPTNAVGDTDFNVGGGNPSMLLSQQLFSLLPFLQVPTTLCRINEPPKGRDVNVVTNEDIPSRSVTFSLERDVYAGEELFIDYGLSYDRSMYRPASPPSVSDE
jgi:hypothetical protein